MIDQYENKYKGIETTLNERATGQAFVEPLLGVLGWNIRDLDEVYPEFYVTGSGRVDYVLMINSMPVVYLEIKKLCESLEGKRSGVSYEDQTMDYAWKKKATWAVLTNFKELRLYNAKSAFLFSVFPIKTTQLNLRRLCAISQRMLFRKETLVNFML